MAKNKASIYSALMAYILIATARFIAGTYTNSSSISEDIHSLADTINKFLQEEFKIVESVIIQQQAYPK